MINEISEYYLLKYNSNVANLKSSFYVYFSQLLNTFRTFDKEYKSTKSDFNQFL